MAARRTTQEGTIAGLKRLASSVNGNPRYRVTLVGGAVLDTQSDASVGYAIGNPEYRDVPVVLTTTHAGRIVGIRTQDGQHRDGETA
jgi:hypothetical protein